MSDTKTFTFDDTVISTIAKTLQLAILTGTDVVDNLRQIEVQQNDNGTLSITPNYNSKFEHWVASLLEELESRQDVVETEKSEEAPGLFE